MITRRSLIFGSGAVASAIVLDMRLGRGERTRSGGHLFIPPLIDARQQNNAVKLRARAGFHEFLRGKPAKTFGYSGPVLGPTLRFRRGDHVEMTVENALDAPRPSIGTVCLFQARKTADLMAS